jgi:hypothetical protein
MHRGVNTFDTLKSSLREGNHFTARPFFLKPSFEGKMVILSPKNGLIIELMP